jgi:hypothetical protein
MSVLSFFSNPVVKTIVSNVAGAAVASIENAFANPTGGTATALANNPAYLAAYGAAALYVHNLLSSWTFIQAPAVSTPAPAAPSAPPSAPPAA